MKEIRTIPSLHIYSSQKVPAMRDTHMHTLAICPELTLEVYSGLCLYIQSRNEMAMTSSKELALALSSPAILLLYAPLICFKQRRKYMTSGISCWYCNVKHVRERCLCFETLAIMRSGWFPDFSSCSTASPHCHDFKDLFHINTLAIKELYKNKYINYCSSIWKEYLPH